MADVIDISSRYVAPPGPGNGAREALIEVLMERGFDLATESDEKGCDLILAELWARGFKIVPLDGTEN